jgi:hypothetical protein
MVDREDSRSLAECLEYFSRDLLREKFGSGGLEMYVFRILQLGDAWGDVCIQVIDRDAVFPHHLGGDFIVLRHLTKLPLWGQVAIRDRRCGGPDDLGTRGLQLRGHDGAQIGFVVCGLHLTFAIGHVFQIVNAVVEVDHIPLACAEPLVEVGHAVLRRPAIGGDAVYICFALRVASARAAC